MTTQQKERLDNLVVSLGLAESRQRAQRLIMAGQILVGGKVADKPGEKHSTSALITQKGPGMRYVSRGGYKLEGALDHFSIDVSSKTALDVGASTGGFTDCLLQHGAAEVWAVDVGYGQIHERLRHDSRVHLMERTNARFLTGDSIDARFQVVTMDVSFISVKKIVPALIPLMRPACELVILVKPQFEAGRAKVKQGVVRDPAIHEEVLLDMCLFFGQSGFRLRGLWYSPITGPEGNIEFLLYATLGAAGSGSDMAAIDSVHAVKSIVSQAHERLASK